MRRRRGGGPRAPAWEREAETWARWAREPNHDSYWLFHRERFLDLLPPPGDRTLDLGCGEGRLARDLVERGHRVTAVDRSPTMARLAARAGTRDLVLADAAALPFGAGDYDLVIAFMSLQDMDDMPAAVAEAGRALRPGGRFCLAIVHPINAAGQFESEEPPVFVIREDYFERRPYSDTAERAGLQVTFHQRHWPLQDYFAALEAAGLLSESVREPVPGNSGKWDRVPLFLHIRALKPGSGISSASTPTR